MKYRKLDSNGDYTFGSKQNEFYSDKEAVAQAVKTRLYLLLGEWWERLEDGLPLFQEMVAISNTYENRKKLDLIVSERILNTDGVIKITSFSSKVDKKTYIAECVIDTKYGEITITFDSSKFSEVK